MLNWIKEILGYAPEFKKDVGKFELDFRWHVEDWLDEGATIAKADVKKLLVLVRTKISNFQDLEVMLGDARRANAYLQSEYTSLMTRLREAEQEASTIRKEWAIEEQTARTYFERLSLADEGVELLHEILGEAGVEITDNKVIETIRASLLRRLQKGQTPVPGSAEAKAVPADAPAVQAVSAVAVTQPAPAA